MSKTFQTVLKWYICDSLSEIWSETWTTNKYGHNHYLNKWVKNSELKNLVTWHIAFKFQKNDTFISIPFEIKFCIFLLMGHPKWLPLQFKVHVGSYVKMNKYFCSQKLSLIIEKLQLGELLV